MGDFFGKLTADLALLPMGRLDSMPFSLLHLFSVEKDGIKVKIGMVLRNTLMARTYSTSEKYL